MASSAKWYRSRTVRAVTAVTATMALAGTPAIAQAQPMSSSGGMGSLENLVPNLPELPALEIPSLTSPNAKPSKALGQAVQDAESKARDLAAPTCGVNSQYTAAASWGIKQSFRKYLKSPIAAGGWETQGVKFTGAQTGNGSFNFTADNSKIRVSGNQATIPLKGSMRLYGHMNLLDIKLSNMSLKVNGSTAQFIADFNSNTVNRPAPGAKITGHETGTQSAIATFKLDKPFSANQLKGGKQVTLRGNGTITADGNRAFGGNYGPGNNDADPLALTISDGCNGQQASAPVPAEGNFGNTTGGAAPAAPSAPATQQAPLQQPSFAAPANAPGGGDMTCAASDRGVSQSRLSWGVKESFRNYLRAGTANGGWRTSGASYNGGAFVFPGNSGKVSSDGSSVSLQNTGSVNFYGHDGVLNTTFTNPAVAINGGSGTLTADVVSNDQNGNKRSFGRIAVGTLSVNGGVNGGVYEAQAAVTLTAQGSSALAGFYPAGTAMDTLRVQAVVGSAGDCDTGLADIVGESGEFDDVSLGDLPEDETPDDVKNKDKDKKNGKSLTSLLDDDGADDKAQEASWKNASMALANNPGTPVALVLALIAGVFGLTRLVAAKRAANSYEDEEWFDDEDA